MKLTQMLLLLELLLLLLELLLLLLPLVKLSKKRWYNQEQQQKQQQKQQLEQQRLCQFHFNFVIFVLQVRFISVLILLQYFCHPLNVHTNYNVNVSMPTFSVECWLLCDRCCLLYTSPSPRDQRGSRMPSSA